MKWGSKMPAYLASTESLPVGSAVSFVVVTEAMMERSCRAAPDDSLDEARTKIQRAEAPPISSRILAVVAHELRGPLTPLRMASQLIRGASAECPEIVRLTEMIDRQVNGLERLAQDLMDATRVEQEALRLNRANIEINALLADTCEVTVAAAAAKHQTFIASMPDGMLRVDGDPFRLTQAVSNLLHNAVKYTQAHGNIRLSVFVEGNELVIKIDDDGAGISSSLLPHIFDLFAQSSRTISASAGGLGIGLAVVKAIAESHGGTVSAVSAGPGKGSEFTLKLPIVTSTNVPCGSVVKRAVAAESLR
jgi:signal transduction histidine kinase